MPNFHETRMGQEFFLRDIPKIRNNLERIANAMEGKIIPHGDLGSTCFCQKIDSKLFSATMEKMNITPYYQNSTGWITFRKDDTTVNSKELTFDETANYIKQMLKETLKEEINTVEDIHTRNNFVYISFTVKNKA